MREGRGSGAFRGLGQGPQQHIAGAGAGPTHALGGLRMGVERDGPLSVSGREGLNHAQNRLTFLRQGKTAKKIQGEKKCRHTTRK